MASNFTFTPPKNFYAPDGTKPGDKFDLVCTFKMTSKGQISLVQLGETDMEEGKPQAPSYGQVGQDMAGSMQSEMGGGSS